jgi:hypothetical protein
MLVRGVAVSYETIRRWCAKFGQAYANQLRRRRPRPGDKWHLDEVFVGINGRLRYLWRAVDQHGNVLDVLVQSRRNAVAAKRFFRKLLNGLRYVPRVLVTDKLGSYQVAHPTTRTGDETLQIVAACATVPVRLQRHLRTLPAATASAQRDRLANRDGRPLRGLASGHRARRCRLRCERPNGVPSRLLQTQLRHYTFQSTRQCPLGTLAARRRSTSLVVADKYYVDLQ